MAADADPTAPAMRGSPTGLRELFGNRHFTALWAATGLQLIVNSAIQFVLVIRVVELSGSSLAAVALVVSLAAPPVVFGLGAGVLLDRLDKRKVLLVTVVLRAGLTALLLVADNVGAILAVAFLTATAGQFALPAGAAAVPAFVQRSQLLSANSAFQFAATSAQLIGLVALSPIMLKALGFDASYIVSAVLLLLTAPLIALLPPLPPHARAESAAGEAGWLRQAQAAARAGLGDVREAALRVWRDRLTAVALIQLVTGVMLLFMFAVLVPRFVQDVIGRAPEDAVFVFWPTGVGTLLMLVALPALERRYPVTRLASAGLCIITAVVALLGVLNLLTDSEGALFWLTLVLSFPLGLSYAMVNAPAQTLLHHRTPPQMRGRMFSAQLMMANALSMAALVIVGGVTDAWGVREALFLLAAGVFAITLGSLWLGRSGRAAAAAA